MSFVLDYKDKVVLVTGVSSGIGLGVAREFARAGAHVAGCSRKSPDDASVQAFREVVEQEGVRSFYRPADVTDAEELKGFVEEAARTFGRIDMVVSNAGMNVFEGAEGCTEERWHYNLDLNLASHWRLARLCKPYLEKSGEGVLLLMTSNHAFSSIPGCFPYNVTKTAITGLVRSLAIEWGPAVRTVGVAPGFIDTAGNDTWFDSFPDPGSGTPADDRPASCQTDRDGRGGRGVMRLSRLPVCPVYQRDDDSDGRWALGVDAG